MPIHEAIEAKVLFLLIVAGGGEQTTMNSFSARPVLPRHGRYRAAGANAALTGQPLRSSAREKMDASAGNLAEQAMTSAPSLLHFGMIVVGFCVPNRIGSGERSCA